MPDIRVTMDDLPRHLKGFADQVPFAVSRALNDTAFAVKKKMPVMMGDDLTLRNNYTAGTAIRFDKSHKSNLEAFVGSIAWYALRNVEGGRTIPDKGIVYEGKKYLLVPAKGRRNKKGRLKDVSGKLASKPFVIKANSGALLLVARLSSGRTDLFTFGKLELLTQHDPEFDWQREVNSTIEKEFSVSFLKNMDKAARTAR